MSRCSWPIPCTNPRTRWNANGQKKSETEYRDGRPHGESLGWRPNGQRKWQGEYRNGMKHGGRHRWHTSGQKSFDGGAWNDKPQGEECSEDG